MAFIKHHFNRAIRPVAVIVIRAAVLAVAWAVLSGISILMYHLLKYVADVYGVPEDIQMKMAQFALSFPIVLGVVMTISVVIDVLTITFAGYWRSGESDTLDDEDTSK